MQFSGGKLKEYLKQMVNSLNIFLVILFSIISYFLTDVGFSILNLNSTNIIVSMQENQDRPFVPDCLGIRGGFIDGNGWQVTFGEIEVIRDQYEKFFRGECPAQMPREVQA